jgi:starch-binding outer membrane protein, SusD/RagB family
MRQITGKIGFGKIRPIILLVFILAMVSCESLLHEEETSIGKITTYEQLLNAAGGVYGSLATATFPRSSNFYYVNLKGDDLDGGNAIYASHYASSACASNNNVYTNSESEQWGLLYQIIASCNNVIVQYDLKTTTDTETREILGEIYLIRAYCHFRLTRTYGQVPIIDNIDIDYTVSKPSFEDIYEFIEGDLLTALELLPQCNSQARIPYVTPHCGTAKALLAELYLSWGGYPCNDASKYAQAAQAASDVIDNATTYNLELLDDFASLWDKEHYYNQESVWSLYTELPEKATVTEVWDNLFSGWYGEDANSNYYIGPDLKVEFYFYHSEYKFFNEYPSGYRKDITFLNTIYVPPMYAKYGVDTGYVNIDQITSCERVAYRKFYYDPTMREMYYYPSWGGSWLYHFYIGTTRAYLLRYAQTLLTYAEATARAGNLTDKAYECVNRIRRRAHHLDQYIPSEYDLPRGLSADAFADSVVQERAWELAGEPEGRWFDLVRLQKVEEETGFTQSDCFFPLLDTILNPNLGRSE